MYSDVIAHAVYHLCVITGGYPPFGNLWDTVQKDNRKYNRAYYLQPPKKINVFYLTEFNLKLILGSGSGNTTGAASGVLELFEKYTVADMLYY